MISVVQCWKPCPTSQQVHIARNVITSYFSWPGVPLTVRCRLADSAGRVALLWILQCFGSHRRRWLHFETWDIVAWINSLKRSDPKSLHDYSIDTGLSINFLKHRWLNDDKSTVYGDDLWSQPFFVKSLSWGLVTTSPTWVFSLVYSQHSQLVPPM